ncbi:hypothetical protein U9M48_041442 [Paspalum notatum var. saurae]|uniref:Uncharacterized protein n=1 Tax=Paspalum notatum var. saurae TaxID=547442 RepID=A0AAQ3XF95_PASNO
MERFNPRARFRRRIRGSSSHPNRRCCLQRRHRRVVPHPSTQASAAAVATPDEPAKEPVLRDGGALPRGVAPFSYLAFVHYPLDADLRRSILKCGAMSLTGFFVALKFIPVAARYHLRRQMFDYDINNKGLPPGEIKVYYGAFYNKASPASMSHEESRTERA